MVVMLLSTDNDIKQATDDPHKNTLDGTEGRLGQKMDCLGTKYRKTTAHGWEGRPRTAFGVKLGKPSLLENL